MSPVGEGVLSLTKFYRLPGLVTELARMAPGMSPEQVRSALGRGHKELADDLVLYSDGAVVDDPLLQACRAGSESARVLIWVGLVMADHRIAETVETYLTDTDGKLVPDHFNADELEGVLQIAMPESRGPRKAATNILSYLRDSGLVEPTTHGNTIVGISQTATTAPFVRDVVRYIMFRLQHLELLYPFAGDDADIALALNANRWLNLTKEEFRAAYNAAPADVSIVPPAPASPPSGGTSPPIATRVPIEAHNTESYEVSGQTSRTAFRREQPLVKAYEQWMSGRSEIERLRFRPPGTPAHLYNDVHDSTRNNLIESKADGSRPSIRMAIGQLMDYRRFAPAGVRLAVLTERRPHPDLEALLDSLNIASIWRSGDGFVDNADGTFV